MNSELLFSAKHNFTALMLKIFNCSEFWQTSLTPDKVQNVFTHRLYRLHQRTAKWQLHLHGPSLFGAQHGFTAYFEKY